MYKKHRRRFLTGLTKLFVVPLFLNGHAYAQSETPEYFSLFLEGSKHSAVEREAIKRRVLTHLKNQMPERIELSDLSGPIITNAACPVGFVRKADYKFSIEGITIIKDEGVDCDSLARCRAWQVEAEPEDEMQSYDFSIQLECTADDTVQNRNNSEVDSFISADVRKKANG
jgi:hypothetical protein